MHYWNLIFSENVLKTVLSLYMEDKTLPLPFLEEVLICTPQTTEEEVLMRVYIFVLLLLQPFLFQGNSIVEKSYW